MKAATIVQSNDDGKTTQTKTKKGAKSRAKSTKTSSDANMFISNSNNTPGPKNFATTPTTSINIGTSNVTNMVNAPTPSTPTSSLFTNNTFDSIAGPNPNAISGGSIDININIPIKNAQKNYAGLEGRSIKIIWDQHDQDHTDLAPDVCARLAEDASYKLWEVCNHLKVFARNSGGTVTYDLVNEALSQSDCPPKLGAMETDWERIDYDGSYFFHADKIIELRDEYQREEILPLSKDIELTQFQAIDDKHLEQTKKYSTSIMNVIINGDTRELDQCLNEVAFSPIIGSILRVLLIKIIQLLAFKQNDIINVRCWRLLKACALNPSTNHIICREEIFHLAEILICQLMAPFESIKDLKGNNDNITSMTNGLDIKLNGEDIKPIINMPIKQKHSYLEPQQQSNPTHDPPQLNHCCKFRLDNSDSDEENNLDIFDEKYSGYFASPVEAKYVDQLCDIIGVLAAENGLFQRECIHHILRRLKRFFQGREPSSDKDYNYVGRGARGLIALGDYAFREFIPYFYKMKLEDIPESISQDFLYSGIYLNGQNDIFLYECLEAICGADKLQPFLTHYAQFHDKYLKHRIKKAKKPTFNITSKPGVRRLEWNSAAAAMCHGDDPNKTIKPNETLYELFPDLQTPNLNINRPGTIRFKFAGCRPVVLKSKNPLANPTKSPTTSTSINPMAGLKIKSEPGETVHSDILIARRKLYKPLTNGYKMVRLSNYYSLRI